MITVVVPCLNEEACLPLLVDRLVPVLEPLGTWEVLFVDDGSTDGTLAALRSLHARDPRLHFLSLSRNFGHEAATTAGMAHARGQWVALIDADLQDPPEVLTALLARGAEGFDVVTARRRARSGERLSKRLTSALFYRAMTLLVDDFELPLDTGDFRVLSRKAVDGFLRMPERNRFVRGMIAWSGYPTAEVTYERDARAAGETKYGPLQLAALALDAVIGFSTVPLRISSWLGISITALAAVGAIVVVVQRLFLDLDIEGYAFQTVSMLVLGGVQLVMLGVLGEYVGRIYDEVKRRPLYLVAEASTPEKPADPG
ncbi:MAG: glycosyltransferase family 2 protein [Alphaproteobacteria bacterium]|nr:glycosyltransferase family 2 protein [Alphaproteobacteria bacterium]